MYGSIVHDKTDYTAGLASGLEISRGDFKNHERSASRLRPSSIYQSLCFLCVLTRKRNMTYIGEFRKRQISVKARIRGRYKMRVGFPSENIMYRLELHA